MNVTRRSTLLALGAVASNPAGAQTIAWSDRPIRLIAGFAPGGPADVVARIIADHLGQRWPVPVVVENRVGAGGNIASQFVARSRPDGAVALVATTSFAVNPAVSSRAGYRLDDFAPAAVLASTPNIVLAHPSFEPRNIEDILTFSRKRPLNIGVPGLGTSGHLSVDRLFRVLAKADVQFIPFNGAGPVLSALLARQIDLGQMAMNSAVEQVRSGAVRGVVVNSPRRAKALPDVPTAAELGYPTAVDATWLALLFPARTPPDILLRANEDVAGALQDPVVLRRLEGNGFEPLGGTLEETERHMRDEFTMWAEVARQTGITLD